MAGPRMTHRPRDIVLSLAVILVPLVLIGWFFTQRTQMPVTRVDVGPVIAQARAEAPYQVLAPTGLGEEWIPVRATWDKASATWINGWLTPGEVYVEVAQRPGGSDELVSSRARSPHRDGERDVTGEPWQQYRTDDDRTRALVHRGDDATTVVSGDLSYDDLAAFVGALSAG